jgi:hypothetical protein
MHQFIRVQNYLSSHQFLFSFSLQFIDHLGRDALEITDDQGSTLFHYAVGCLDDSAILKLMEKGAGLMRRNFAEVSFDEDDDDLFLVIFQSFYKTNSISI